mgnify:CR=1 FL=1
MFRQDRTNPSTAVSNWRGRHESSKGWPSTAVSSWLNGGLFGGAAVPSSQWAGIAHASLSLPAATVTWTSTDDGLVGDFSEYMDLVVVAYCKSGGAGAWENCKLTVNNRTGASDYAYQHMTGGGGAVSAYADNTYSAGGIWYPPGTGGSHTANAFGACVYHLFDINSTDKFKNGMHMAGSTGATNPEATMYVWSSYTTDAVTEIDLTATNDFVAGSTFDLFGVKRAAV